MPNLVRYDARIVHSSIWKRIYDMDGAFDQGVCIGEQKALPSGFLAPAKNLPIRGVRRGQKIHSRDAWHGVRQFCVQTTQT
jgi:hypothetical protein